METPTTDTVAMMLAIELSLKSLSDVIDLLKSIFYQKLTGLQRAFAAAAYKHNRGTAEIAVRATDPPQHQLPDLDHKMRIDLPLRFIDPGDMDRAGGVTYEQIFHIGAHIDQKGAGRFLKKLPGL